MAETIPPAEWDFSKCPPNEAHDCWAWEYSRECKLIQEDVSQLRKRKRKKTFDAYFKSISMDIFKGKPGRAITERTCPICEKRFRSGPDL